jgi:hypothetical protein
MVVADAPAGELARHLAWYLPAFALAQLLGIWLAPHKAAGLALLVVMVFLQGYLSRFGHDGHSFGVALFAFYLVGLLAPDAAGVRGGLPSGGRERGGSTAGT